MQDTQPKYFKVCVLLLDQLIAQTKESIQKVVPFYSCSKRPQYDYQVISGHLSILDKCIELCFLCEL